MPLVIMDEVDDGWAKRAALFAAAPQMLELLEELEWARSDFEKRVLRSGAECGVIYPCCVACFNRQEAGHAADCRLAAVLKLAKGE